MKLILVTLILSLVVGCTVKKNSVGSGVTSQPQPEGGVDVGNMTMGIVPHTNASLTYPKSWSADADANTLILQDSEGSKIEARKAEINDLSSPSPTGLQQYLKSKFPDREYKIIDINGLKGVRADIVSTSTEKQSDIYLLSEVSDFLHIQSSLKNVNDGIAKGDEIILTVKVKYKGEAFENSKVSTVTLGAYSVKGQTDRTAAYSFLSDCYPYVGSGCRGVSVLFGNGGGAKFSVGNAGYDHGRIVELGPEQEVPFESVRIEGEYLLAPLTKISIADIYTAFTPKDQYAELDETNLKEGHVYLIRTISWPEEDLIIKVKVDSLVPDKSVTLIYQKLVYVKPEILQKQVDEINKYTLENEKPIEQGEVTLHNRAIWKNYFYASFNFENSTSGNMFITRNSWDLTFSSGCSGTPTLDVPHTGSAIGQVVELGIQDINAIQKSDFPDPNSYRSDCGQQIEKGKVYGIYHHRYDEEIGAIYGAIKVLDLAPDQSWIRLQFRRIHLGKAEHFQKWIDLKIPKGIQSVKLENSSNYAARLFYPFIGKNGLQGSHYYELFEFHSAEQTGDIDSLFTDYRPYGSGRGFAILDQNQDIEKVTLAEVENHKGHFKNSVDLKQGDLIATYLENYHNKTVMVMRVDDLKLGQSVTLSCRYLSRQKTAYSDDKD